MSQWEKRCDLLSHLVVRSGNYPLGLKGANIIILVHCIIMPLKPTDCFITVENSKKNVYI